MSDLPDTIYNEEKFLSSPPAGFDGVFDWAWTDGCFGETKIKPMDIDGIVERHGRFLVFETKNPGVVIPKGQRITLRALVNTGVFTVMVIWGKGEIEEFCVVYPDGKKKEGNTEEEARQVVKEWYQEADNG